MKTIIFFLLFLSIVFSGFFTTSVYMTPEGGMAVRLTNATGTNTIRGMVVTASPTICFAFTNCTNGYNAIGVVYDQNIPNMGLCWIVFSGIVSVLLQSNTYSTNGILVYQTTNARVNITAE